MRLLTLLLAFLLMPSAGNAVAPDEHRDAEPFEDFAVCYGIVRYYSPNPYTRKWSESDWYKVCAYMVSRLEDNDLADVLRLVAPSAAITQEPLAGQITGGDPATATALEHHGSGAIPITVMAKLLYPSLAKYVPYHQGYVMWNDRQQDAPFPAPFTYYSYKLPSGQFCNIVHCDSPSHFDKKATARLRKDALKFWDSHRDPSFDSKARQKIMGLIKDNSVRIADVVVRWNIIRHFYPYFDEEDLNWEECLPEYLLIAERFQVGDKKGLYKWLMQVREFMNPVKDGHLNVQNDFELTRKIGSYVTEYYSDCSTLAVNDTVLFSCPHINGGDIAILDSIGHQSAQEYFGERKKRVNAATEKYRDWRTSYGLLASPAERSEGIIYHNAAGKQGKDSIAIRFKSEPPVLTSKKIPIPSKLGDDILYIDATAKEFSLKALLQAYEKGYDKFVFDLRGYPSYDFQDVLEHLMEEEKPYIILSVPVSRFPFRNNLIFEESKETIKPKQPTLQGKMVFLCDETTISWGETILMLVKGHSLGTIIGAYTAGTNGDATRFNLPFFPFMMTGLRASHVDGSVHHALGVEPDIHVCNYAADILAGRDRILESAIAFLKDGK